MPIFSKSNQTLCKNINNNNFSNNKYFKIININKDLSGEEEDIISNLEVAETLTLEAEENNIKMLDLLILFHKDNGIINKEGQTFSNSNRTNNIKLNKDKT